MYNDFFGLKALPFNLAPRTDEFINLSNHQQCYELIKSYLHEQDGIMKIIADVGCGKTLIAKKVCTFIEEDIKRQQKKQQRQQQSSNQNNLQSWINDSLGVKSSTINSQTTPSLKNKAVIYVNNPSISSHEFLLLIAKSITNQDIINERNLIESDLIHIFESNRKNIDSIILIIDEAQAISYENLNLIEFLLNSELNTILKIVIFAQHEFDKLINKGDCKKLRQQICMSYYLQPLSVSSCQYYINQRLILNGYQGSNLFNRQAHKAIFKYSQGVPRAINNLCHKSLMISYKKNKKRIDKQDVKQAFYDSKTLSNFKGYFILLGAAGTLGCLSIIYILY